MEFKSIKNFKITWDENTGSIAEVEVQVGEDTLAVLVNGEKIRLCDMPWQVMNLLSSCNTTLSRARYLQNKTEGDLE